MFKRLKNVSEYYSQNRKAGHTLMIVKMLRSLSEDDDVAYMVANREHGDRIRKEMAEGKIKARVRIVARGDLGTRLLGTHLPLMIDHFALQEMIDLDWEEGRRLISSLESKILEKNTEINELLNTVYMEREKHQNCITQLKAQLEEVENKKTAPPKPDFTIVEYTVLNEIQFFVRENKSAPFLISDIYKSLIKNKVSISRTSVYRSAKSLSDKNVLTKTDVGDRNINYTLNGAYQLAF